MKIYYEMYDQQGVSQDSVMPPLFFNIYAEYIFQETILEHSECFNEKMQPRWLPTPGTDKFMTKKKKERKAN